MTITPVQTGLERLKTDPPALIKGRRLGLLANPASVDSGFVHAARIIHDLFPGRLTTLFSPQHGFHAEKQDNMIESPHGTDPQWGIPVYSLYSRTRIPTRDMFKDVDILIIDLQDVGTRVYTFMYTMSYCLEAAAQNNIGVLVLDRPNPIGGIDIEGNILSQDCTSFVGRFPIPMRHGMTMGELALMFNQAFGIHAELVVHPMAGWQREMVFPETGLPWVAPSPNLPTPSAARVYPGQVIFEGTRVSEGRGTALPFELVGAPYLDPDALLDALVEQETLPGVVFRPVCFEPTSGKWAGSPCRGFQLHVTDVRTFKPYRTSLALLRQIIRHHPDQFEWQSPPYEYDYDSPPINLILGSSHLARDLAGPASITHLETRWQQELDRFDQLRQPYLLY